MKVIFKNSKLIFDSNPEKVTMYQSRLISETGLWSFTATGYSASDLYEVQVGTIVKIKNFSCGGSAYMIQALDANKQPVTGSSYGQGQTQTRDTWYEMTISAPSVKYIVLNTRNEDFSTPNAGYEGIITGYTNIIDPTV